MQRNVLRKKLYICAMILVVFLLLLVYFLGGSPSVMGLFNDGAYGESIDLDSSFEYAMQKYTGGMVVFGKDTLVGLSNAGRRTWSVDFSVTDPVLACSGRCVIAGERGGNRILLVAGGKVKYELETEDKIITATVNRRGTFAVVSKERGYKGQVRVYSANGKELYAWHSAEQNILSAAVSDDGNRLAVSVVNMENLSKICSVLQFDLKEAMPITLDVGDENLVSNAFYNGSELIAVGDEALYCFKSDGSLKFKIDYKGRELQNYSFQSGAVCLAFRDSDNGSNSKIEFYKTNGILSGECLVPGAVSSMDSFGRYAAVTTQGKIFVISKNGKIVSDKETNGIAHKIFLCGSRNRAFMLLGMNAGMHIL